MQEKKGFFCAGKGESDMARKKALAAVWQLRGEDLAPMACAVPGSIAQALLDAEQLAHAADTETCDAWVAHRAWQLEATLALEGWVDARAELALQGLCGSGSVWVNGREAARFTQAASGRALCVDVTDDMAREALTVCVRFDAVAETGPTGILGGAWLHSVSHLAVRGLWVRTEAAQSALAATCHTEVFAPGRYLFCYALTRGEEALAPCQHEAELAPGIQLVRHVLPVPEMALWQVDGPNSPYTIKLTVLRQRVGCDVAVCRTCAVRLTRDTPLPGFPPVLRAIQHLRNPLYGTTWAAPAWQPLTQADVASWLTLLQAVHIRALYVPAPQCEVFYDACDAQGMPVWQGLPADAEEAAPVLARLGHRACIVQWGMLAAYAQDISGGAEAAIGALLSACGDDRPFVGSTPGGPFPSPAWQQLAQGQCLNVAGPSAYLGPELMARYANDDDAVLRVTRCAALPLPPALRAAFGTEQVPWPRAGALWAARGGPLTAPEQEEGAQWFAPEAARTLETACALGRYLQAVTLRCLAERARWRGAAGFLGGSVAHPSPALASDALVEPSGLKRPAFFALSGALAPVHACVRLARTAYWVDMPFEAEVQLLAAPDADARADAVVVTAALYLQNGTLLAEVRWEVPCATGTVGTLRGQTPRDEQVLLLRVEVTRDGRRLDRADTLLCAGLHAPEAALTRAPRTALTLAGTRLRNDGAALALGVAVDGLAEPGLCGWGALLPGEAVAVRPGAVVEGLNIDLTEAALEPEDEAAPVLDEKASPRLEDEAAPSAQEAPTEPDEAVPPREP